MLICKVIEKYIIDWLEIYSKRQAPSDILIYARGFSSLTVFNHELFTQKKDSCIKLIRNINVILNQEISTASTDNITNNIIELIMDEKKYINSLETNSRNGTGDYPKILDFIYSIIPELKKILSDAGLHANNVPFNSRDTTFSSSTSNKHALLLPLIQYLIEAEIDKQADTSLTMSLRNELNIGTSIAASPDVRESQILLVTKSISNICNLKEEIGKSKKESYISNLSMILHLLERDVSHIKNAKGLKPSNGKLAKALEVMKDSFSTINGKYLSDSQAKSPEDLEKDKADTIDIQCLTDQQALNNYATTWKENYSCNPEQIILLTIEGQNIWFLGKPPENQYLGRIEEDISKKMINNVLVFAKLLEFLNSFKRINMLHKLSYQQKNYILDEIDRIMGEIVKNAIAVVYEPTAYAVLASKPIELTSSKETLDLLQGSSPGLYQVYNQQSEKQTLTTSTSTTTTTSTSISISASNSPLKM